MAAPTKKTSTKKSASKTIDVSLVLARVTKNTYRFEAEDEDAPISTLYVNQSAFTKEPSNGVSVTVTVN